MNFDSGLNAEWVRIVKIAKEEGISIEEATKIFLKRYKEKHGRDYSEGTEEEE